MRSFLLTFCLLALTPPAPTAWKVTGSDLRFELSTKDLRALRGDRPVFGLQARRKDFLERFQGDPGEDRSNWEGQESMTVLSVVGTWVSYELFDESYTGGAHPGASDRYVTEDAATPSDEVGAGKAASLLELFPEHDVVEALRGDAYLQKHRVDRKAFAAARTVEALMASLGSGEDCVSFDSGREAVQHAFAFHHLEGDQVAVRIAFDYASEVCRGQKFVVGILLPVPSRLRAALERADRREEGFLMKDAKAAHAPVAAFEWKAP